MNKLVYSALALTLISVPGKASENEWSSLDQEIENLSSSLSAQGNSGPKIGGWIVSSFRYSDDDGAQIEFPPGSGDFSDQAGFQLDTVRIEVEGDAGSDYSYKVSFELSGGDADIEDAYAKWKINDMISGKMGRFRQPFLRSSHIAENKLLFLQRTWLGEAFDNRDLGLGFSGSMETFKWWIAGQNGTDGQAEDFLFSARVEASLMGGDVPMVEGAYGAGESTNLTIGGAVSDDGAVSDGTNFGVDATLTAGPFSVSGEVVVLDDDVETFNTGDLNGDGDVLDANEDLHNAGETPWDVTVSYMFTDMYEVAGRFEDASSEDDATKWTVGVNRYVQGHDIKWQLQYMSQDSDADELEIDQIGLGLAVSF